MSSALKETHVEKTAPLELK
jgi:hypothetical protein